MQAILGSVDEPGRLADLVASNMRLESKAAQAILEEADPLARLQKVHEHLGTELEVSTLQAKIQSEAQEEMSRGQREYYLREQLRAIRRELGDENERARELGQLRQSLEKKRLPAEVRAEALKQLGRMEQMQPESAEASIIRAYLDWILDLPWSRAASDRLDVKKAAADPGPGPL